MQDLPELERLARAARLVRALVSRTGTIAAPTSTTPEWRDSGPDKPPPEREGPTPSKAPGRPS
jgi:hypothetical protein